MKHVFVVQTENRIEECSQDEFKDGTLGISEQTAAIILLERLFPNSFVSSQVNQADPTNLVVPFATAGGDSFIIRS